MTVDIATNPPANQPVPPPALEDAPLPPLERLNGEYARRWVGRGWDGHHWLVGWWRRVAGWLMNGPSKSICRSSSSRCCSQLLLCVASAHNSRSSYHSVASGMAPGHCMPACLCKYQPALWHLLRQVIVYCNVSPCLPRSKAMAEKLVLSANCQQLRTVALRPAGIYGINDIVRLGRMGVCILMHWPYGFGRK